MTSTADRLDQIVAIGTPGTLVLDLQEPSIKYEIRNFLKDKDVINDERFALQIKELHGIEGNFELDMYGIIARPDRFKALKCFFSANQLNSAHYEDGLRGRIGTGSWGQESFYFCINVPPQMVKDLLAFRSFKGRFYTDFNDGPPWLRVTVFISNYRESADGETVVFDIDSVSS